MPQRPAHTGLPSRQQVLDFIASASDPAGKREIARAFGLKGQEKIALKALLRDMADEGLIDGEKRAFHRMGGVPKVTVLRVAAIEDGEAIAIPDNWSPDDATPPPRIRLVERGRSSALKLGDRVLAQPHSQLSAVEFVDLNGRSIRVPLPRGKVAIASCSSQQARRKRLRKRRAN